MCRVLKMVFWLMLQVKWVCLMVLLRSLQHGTAVCSQLLSLRPRIVQSLRRGLTPCPKLRPPIPLAGLIQVGVTQAGSTLAETALAGAAQAEAAQVGAAQAEAVQAEAVQAEVAQAEVTLAEAEVAQAGAAQAGAAQAGAAQAELDGLLYIR